MFQELTILNIDHDSAVNLRFYHNIWQGKELSSPVILDQNWELDPK